MGLGEQANRLPKAIERTAPMAFFLYSLVVVWFGRVGHQTLRFPPGRGTSGSKSRRSPTC